jgi:hypothetical protein
MERLILPLAAKKTDVFGYSRALIVVMPATKTARIKATYPYIPG